MLLPFTWTDLQQFQLWQDIDIVLIDTYPYYSLFKIIHLGLSSFIFALGCYHCINVVIINKKAHTVRNSPDFLVTDGYYGKVRNPMYTYFLFIFTALSFALTSNLALIIPASVLIFLFILIFIEEKTMLQPKFGEEYISYKKKVPRRLLRNWHIVIILLLVSFNIIGIFF